MKRPPWGAEKKAARITSLSVYPSIFFSLPFISLSPLSFLVSPSSINQLRQIQSTALLLQTGTTWSLCRMKQEEEEKWGHFCDECHCGTAFAISLPSSSFIIHADLYFNKWREACSSPARPHRHQPRRLSRPPPYAALTESSSRQRTYLWQSFSVIPQKAFKADYKLDATPP